MTSEQATRLLLLTSLASLLGGVLPAPTKAWCLQAQNWQGYTAVPVYHTIDLAANLQHDDGSPWTETELQHEIRWILGSINSYSNAQLPLLYDAGTSAICDIDNCQIPGAINIAPNKQTDPMRFCDAWTIGTATVGFVVYVERYSVCPAAIYEHFAPTWEWNRQTLRGFLTHELGGHGMGLAHSHGGCDNLTCATAPCSVMDAGSGDMFEAISYYEDDILGLRGIYGLPNYPVREHWESSDGVTWGQLASATPTDLQPLFALSASSGNKMFLTYRHPSTRRPHARLWDWASFGWTDWSDSRSSTTQGYTGSAWDPSTSRGYSAYLLGETQTNVEKWFGLSRHTSSLVHSEYSWAGTTTRRHGVSLAHDPKSGARVQVWLATQGQIQIQVIEGTTYIAPWSLEWDPGPPAGDAVQAYDTPSVTCGDASISLNCVVAWADPALTGTVLYHYLRWVHFSIAKVGSTWQLSLGPIMSQSYIAHGPPVVSYRGPATASRPYVIMWPVQSQPGRTFRVYTALKSTGSQATWDNVILHATYNWRLAPALGNAINSAELVHARR